ncbi:MAG TPA: tyrosine--tRNA ligase, partial [Candidatus Dormibacteraeota bacterium]|nr:tyrosine--tRNA ligase [Candidatus Dormibacteraeota bacterium]
MPATNPTPDLLAELGWRGMVAEVSEGLAARLAARPISGYVGFDPSGPSLHVGHLVQVFLLTHLQRSGGRPVAVVGGGTGMIGDPSGQSAERNLLDEDALAANVATLRGQLERFLDFGPGPSGAEMVDNREWLGAYSLLGFLRDVGKHFTLGYMLAKDSVQSRLAGGLSYTEFSYMTLQATDFLHLHRERGVDLQMGG